jgi:hypothetical protein
LAEVNDEAKVRRAAKSKIIGTARVMKYEHLEKARAERAAKEAEKEAAVEAKKAKKAKKGLRATPSVEEAATDEGKRVRKRKRSPEADASEPKAKMAQISQTQADGVIASEPWQAPVARMW